MLDGKRPKPLILDKNLKIKWIYLSDETVFLQHKYITFGSGGKLFVGNEGEESNATILEV